MNLVRVFELSMRRYLMVGCYVSALMTAWLIVLPSVLPAVFCCMICMTFPMSALLVALVSAMACVTNVSISCGVSGVGRYFSSMLISFCSISASSGRLLSWYWVMESCLCLICLRMTVVISASFRMVSALPCWMASFLIADLRLRMVFSVTLSLAFMAVFMSAVSVSFRVFVLMLLGI